jgi:hypothetical protein
LGSFYQNTLKYACQLHFQRFKAVCPYPEKLTAAKEKLFGAEILRDLRAILNF